MYENITPELKHGHLIHPQYCNTIQTVRYIFVHIASDQFVFTLDNNNGSDEITEH